MLTVPQIEALRQTNPQLYESLKRLAGASLGPNQGWSLDNQITDGTNYARVATGALTAGNVDPSKAGVLMKGSVPPTWSGRVHLRFHHLEHHLELERPHDLPRRRHHHALSRTARSPSPGSPPAPPIIFILTGTMPRPRSAGWREARARPPTRKRRRQIPPRSSRRCKGVIPLSQGAIVAATTTSGTGGGSGGGSGSCLRAGTVVLTKERGTVAIETCQVGEHLRCPSPATGEAWTRIVRLEVRDADTFIRLHFSNAESLDVTPHHIFTLADGSPMRAERLCLSDILVGRFGRITLKRIEAIVEESQKVTVSCEPYAPVLRRPPRRHRAHAQLHFYLVNRLVLAEGYLR